VRFPSILAVALVLAGCRSVEHDAGPVIPNVEVRVLRLRPEEALITLGHHDNRSFMAVEFSVIEPEEYRGRTLSMKFLPDYPGELFSRREFRLKLPRNVVEGKNRERKNQNGTTTVWADTDSIWNFESMMVEEKKEANHAPEPMSGLAPGHGSP
jgi:hypothetical protein